MGNEKFPYMTVTGPHASATSCTVQRRLVQALWTNVSTASVAYSPDGGGLEDSPNTVDKE